MALSETSLDALLLIACLGWHGAPHFDLVFWTFGPAEKRGWLFFLLFFLQDTILWNIRSMAGQAFLKLAFVPVFTFTLRNLNRQIRLLAGP